MIKESFLDAIAEYQMFLPGEMVLVAVSGGPDSCALLSLLNDHKDKLGISLHVAHLNHMLRKNDAELDLRFVEGLAQKMGLPISVESRDVAALAAAERRGIEEAARIARYEFFERLADKIGARKIAVGHTAEDNIETFLMRLLRGSGLKGLCSIPARRGRIVRPLIKVWRREVEDYVSALKIIPRRDYTNYESKYMRNSIRLKLVPQLKLYNMNIKDILIQTVLMLNEDRYYLENETEEVISRLILEEGEGKVELDLKKLQEYPLAIKRHLLRLAIEKVKGDLNQLTFDHVRSIIDKIGAKEKWELHLPDGIFVFGNGTVLTVSRERLKKAKIEPFRYAVSIPGETVIPEIGLKVRVSEGEKLGQTGPKTAFIDQETLGRDIIVRNKLPGDRFQPIGLSGTKKLQDFFVDEKVPQDDRDAVPVFESAGRIIWLGGLRLDDRSKVTPNTRRIVKFELIKS
ncbi:tRNA lysidine(34) synthetase TilS [candidate division WOR-1 bacterium RIFOXYA12_FULL_52_29]|uniref:tRNA(Ile)-lysidine synthase n=1 Tax=candidate division WOR-1 bacterium RIFOXYC12_FULL_54_18 TaxID=1802584 RepID=A0A1F4T5W6_UNCSA|nr:MAG: tRNA lysidine(34) synthetase TilS [candidate division WOR-1 bacterium RIFOXYA2_FULL_51_19]OGC17707.1 MAG: tRNA lysidine(34) synthetase TilS [candidate division WOR-1 bacterium RIFOXYA12_FULL_52_29]OGC26564.1 MAG: tRNA lysidine(34) synthetase TilS [candidate division WOR-1 bacterium RIFOXYB2_FULL_45_9]OGC28124.1 MAG: tRNA lysidine(34) synthetase TilS [candidate division WOR-1 bacterium RIFOXYC12_FULL_54_18]OGC29590.1 MAG: tRNA lysidine(34) synthetase TilS [candidate division WOR-1 bacter